MSTFSTLPEFDKELKRLVKKYPTLISDIEDLKSVLIDSPTGIGKNFIILKSDKEVQVVKVKVHCESLRSRVIRLIYAFRPEVIEFVYIEVYFKGDKETENTERINGYLENLNKIRN